MGKFLDWYFEPLVKIFTPILGPEEIESGVRLKPSAPINLFRPRSISEYVGQEKIKKTISSYIEGVKKRNISFPHTLIYGNAGCGKTTLARIIANELRLPFVETISSEIKSSYDVAWKLHKFDGQKGIVFLDEIHALDRNTVEGLYPLMEDFTYNNKSITPFTLIGATTELGEIIKDKRPFADRFKLWLELEPYTSENITTIIKHYGERIFPKDKLDESVYTTLGGNARSTPRMGIRLLESCIYTGDVNQTLINSNILKDGYTQKDLKCLRYLNENQKGVGLQGLCSFLNIPQELYMYEIEPYLLQNNLIIRTPRGRKITVMGISKLQELSLL